MENSAIDLMMEEHNKIRRICAVADRMGVLVMEGGIVDFGDFTDLITFIRSYSDGLHHKKEEDGLFKIMLEKLGSAAETLVRNGMLVEHDMGRSYVREAELALERFEKTHDSTDKLKIISNFSSWADLLMRHTSKEDEVVYTFARRALSKDDMDKVDEMAKSFEESNDARAVASRTEKILLTLEGKYTN